MDFSFLGTDENTIGTVLYVFYFASCETSAVSSYSGLRCSIPFQRLDFPPVRQCGLTVKSAPTRCKGKTFYTTFYMFSGRSMTVCKLRGEPKDCWLADMMLDEGGKYASGPLADVLRATASALYIGAIDTVSRTLRHCYNLDLIFEVGCYSIHIPLGDGPSPRDTEKSTAGNRRDHRSRSFASACRQRFSPLPK